MTALVIAEHNITTLLPATSKAVTAAKACGSIVDVLVVGHETKAIAAQAAALEGINRVLHADAPHYAEFLAEQIAPLIAKLAPNYSHIVMSATTTGRDILPRVAGLLGVAMVSDVVRVETPGSFTHPIYAGNALETVQVTSTPIVFTSRATAFDFTANGGNAPIESIPETPAVALSTFVSRETTSTGSRPELTNARVVISGGLGLGSAENFKRLEKLADTLGAAIGASRAAVDAGYAPNSLQVGQTGKVVAPELYIAIGISGAIQHIAGMKDSRVIVAINKNDNATIMELADYALVGDWAEILPELEKALA